MAVAQVHHQILALLLHTIADTIDVQFFFKAVGHAFAGSFHDDARIFAGSDGLLDLAELHRFVAVCRDMFAFDAIFSRSCHKRLAQICHERVVVVCLQEHDLRARSLGGGCARIAARRRGRRGRCAACAAGGEHQRCHKNKRQNRR